MKRSRHKSFLHKSRNSRLKCTKVPSCIRIHGLFSLGVFSKNFLDDFRFRCRKVTFQSAVLILERSCTQYRKSLVILDECTKIHNVNLEGTKWDFSRLIWAHQTPILDIIGKVLCCKQNRRLFYIISANVTILGERLTCAPVALFLHTVWKSPQKFSS